jgi:hypothetical protein
MVYSPGRLNQKKFMSVHALIRTTFVVLTIGYSPTSVHSQSDSLIRIVESNIAPCLDQGLLFRETVSELKHEIKGNELLLDFIFTSACCQTIKVALQEGVTLPNVSLQLNKSGEVCDCYCNYPVKVRLMIPQIKHNREIQLQINQKPAGKIPTGF